MNHYVRPTSRPHLPYVPTSFPLCPDLVLLMDSYLQAPLECIWGRTRYSPPFTIVGLVFSSPPRLPHISPTSLPRLSHLHPRLSYVSTAPRASPTSRPRLLPPYIPISFPYIPTSLVASACAVPPISCTLSFRIWIIIFFRILHCPCQCLEAWTQRRLSFVLRPPMASNRRVASSTLTTQGHNPGPFPRAYGTAKHTPLPPDTLPVRGPRHANASRPTHKALTGGRTGRLPLYDQYDHPPLGGRSRHRESSTSI